jgi:hypothetical protein
MKLILLRCPNCAEPLKPDNDDVVVVCTNCHTAVAIDADGPRKVETHYAVATGSGTELSEWRPFWVFEGTVDIQKREIQGGGRSSGKDAAALWSVPRRLYVPAWDLSLHTAQDVGSRLIQEQPRFHKIPRPENAQLAVATVTPDDAIKLLEFIVLAIEARRRDWLEDLEFQLDVGEPEFWAMPEP